MLKIIYIKWVLRHCPHFCMFCEFKDEMNCTQEFKEWSWKELHEMKKKGGYYGH